ncbi:hypothetical protein [Desulfosoma caldarium]|uniref:Uncharacterized protein n=1 Tax=Desulfosoma caldarium TaxID=610254 RepID=A0A3N1VKJ1_9BACT|nr:hypothetical protein [Desulfosoma caldarium]ROR03324.1 hypothetical protein EDC27_0592 [Desulfosoma caldarium]
MKDKRNLHQKVQELCDCFATTDPLMEMAKVSEEPDKEEAALKWVALAVLHGVTAGAEKIKVFRHADGSVAVSAKYREAPLRTPGAEVGGQVIEILKRVVGLEGEKGSSPLALGIRDSSLELKVKYKKEDSKETVTIKFPG